MIAYKDHTGKYIIIGADKVATLASAEEIPEEIILYESLPETIQQHNANKEVPHIAGYLFNTNIPKKQEHLHRLLTNPDFTIHITAFEAAIQQAAETEELSLPESFFQTIIDSQNTALLKAVIANKDIKLRHCIIDRAISLHQYTVTPKPESHDTSDVFANAGLNKQSADDSEITYINFILYKRNDFPWTPMHLDTIIKLSQVSNNDALCMGIMHYPLPYSQEQIKEIEQSIRNPNCGKHYSSLAQGIVFKRDTPIPLPIRTAIMDTMSGQMPLMPYLLNREDESFSMEELRRIYACYQQYSQNEPVHESFTEPFTQAFSKAESKAFMQQQNSNKHKRSNGL